MGTRATWNALAHGETEVYIGNPARARQELESLFGRLGAEARGVICVEVGCGPGRMTAELASRFERVVAVDVSPAMLERARVDLAARGVDNVELRLVAGDRLDTVEDASAGTVVCYLVLQHLPSGEAVAAYLREFARVLGPRGEAFVQLPLLDHGLRARAWRTGRRALVPLVARIVPSPTNDPAFRGFRLTAAELDAGLAQAGLRVVARDVGPDAPYRYATDVFLRLAHAG